MARRYVILDVFTDRLLAGNPLAVVLDAAGLETPVMQAIAREFNLSETVFLVPADDETRKARLRILTPDRELPFAGHPTVGTAVLLGLIGVAGKGKDFAFEIEEEVGVIACRVRLDGPKAGFAEFSLPRLPERAGDAPEAALVAAALGLDVEDIGFDGHAVTRFTAGNPFCFVPVTGLDAIGRIEADAARWRAAFDDRGDRSVYVYTRETVGAGRAYHARMLEPGLKEDPATGSAVAAFAGVVMAFDRPGDGTHRLVVEQGFEMGRPSLIELTLEVSDGALVSAAIGGSAIVVAEGSLFL